MDKVKCQQTGYSRGKKENYTYYASFCSLRQNYAMGKGGNWWEKQWTRRKCRMSSSKETQFTVLSCTATLPISYLQGKRSSFLLSSVASSSLLYTLQSMPPSPPGSSLHTNGGCVYWVILVRREASEHPSTWVGHHEARRWFLSEDSYTV